MMRLHDVFRLFGPFEQLVHFIDQGAGLRMLPGAVGTHPETPERPV